MYPHIDIYKARDRRKHVEVFLQVPFAVRVIYGLLRGTGAGLTGFAIIWVIFSIWPVVSEELEYRFGKKEVYVESGFAQILAESEAERVAEVQKEADGFGVNSYFSLAVPKISAYSNVIANVDSGNEKEYSKALLEGVAHAKGTNFPGQGKNIFLFAHSTDNNPLNIAQYNAVFYLLRKLEIEDRIIVFFVDKKYEYEITQKVVTSADDVSWLKYNKGEETLILQTCDPPGTTWNRLLVIAKLVS